MTLALGSAPTTGRSLDWQVAIASSGRANIVLPEHPSLELPAFAERSGIRLLFDGRLHDSEEMRHMLGVPPVHSPAELLLRAYEVWGRRMLRQLKGEFALVVIDGRRSSIFAARDRAGSAPLYYSRAGGGIEIAKSIGAFTNLALDKVAVGRYLAGKNLPAEVTPYRQLRRLLPGHSLQFDGASLTVERYWRPPVPTGADGWLDEEELPHFDELLEQAVLRAVDGKPAIFLSGGIDSVSVAAVATDAAKKHGLAAPIALSLHYPGEIDEPPIQKAVAERLGIEHISLGWNEAVGDTGLLGHCIATSARSALPLQNPWRPATDALAFLAGKNGCSSVLTGSGGDEWLTVDALVTSDYLRSGNMSGLVRYLASLSRSLDLPITSLLRGFLWHSGLKPLLRAKLRPLRPAPHAGRRASPEWLVPPPEAAVEPTVDPTGSNYATAVESLPLHPLRALELDEKYEAASEVGLRHTDVYWDADLVEFLCRVPPHLLYRGGRTKGLVRERLARRFPGLGFDRQKKVVRRDLLGTTVLTEGPTVWKGLGGAPALAELGLVEPDKLEEFVRSSFDTREMNSVDALWRIFSLESWVRPRV